MPLGLRPLGSGALAQGPLTVLVTPAQPDPGGGRPSRAGRWTRGRWKRLLEDLREEQEALRAKAEQPKNKKAKKALKAAAAAVADVIGSAKGLLDQRTAPAPLLQMQDALDAVAAAQGLSEMLAAATNARRIAEEALRAIEDEEDEIVVLMFFS